MSFPPPTAFGLPEQFHDWRPGQEDAITAALEAPTRMVGLVLPTGAGKSLIYVALSLLGSYRGVNLTSTKALQRQLFHEYGDMPGTRLMQGQRSYICKALQPGGELFSFYPDRVHDQPTVDQGPCHVGVDCSLKVNGCTYFDAVRKAVRAQTVLTNYAWWFTLRENALIKIAPDLLVLDEAHAAPDALADAIGAEIHAKDVKEILDETLVRPDAWDAPQWVTWARANTNKLGRMLEGTRPSTREVAARLRRAQWLMRALRRIADVDPRLLLTSQAADGTGVRFDVVWAAPYAEDHLFRHVPKIILTSATFTPYTAELLGVVPNQITMYEAGDGFPKDRRPIYVCPATLYGITPVRVDHKMSPDMESCWLEHVDRIIDARPDRKGIIQTVSYRRRDLFVARSRHREQMMTHGRHNTADRIQAFKASGPGTVLVSPAVTTGYDFPYDQCEYLIVCKIPFPDSRDPVVAARTQINSKYPAHLAMQELVQGAGRGMRAADDRCEIFIVDDHARWFLNKHADLAPKWFRRAVKRVTVIPAPPPPLEHHAPIVGTEGDRE